ncbi:MAG TPA: hypothetical protein VMT36_00265, partial [Candidatus Saccharimonadia bacterium]|nr:hypothetical protein [Candidatus Saccharimonadia bacterium]
LGESMGKTLDTILLPLIVVIVLLSVTPPAIATLRARRRGQAVSEPVAVDGDPGVQPSPSEPTG